MNPRQELRPGELEAIEQTLEHRFDDPALLLIALTHASVRTPDSPCNERLEFLGDAVLNLVVAHHLHVERPESSEGRLSILRAQAVRDETLARTFQELDLVRHVRIQPELVPEGSAPPSSILENAYEALVGAIYLDGGLEAARKMVLHTLGETIEAAMQTADAGNYKAVLQQVCQSRYQVLPEYRLASMDGPPHERRYEISADIRGDSHGLGAGPSKKVAQQAAARAALQKLWEEHDADRDGPVEHELGCLFENE